MNTERKFPYPVDALQALDRREQVTRHDLIAVLVPNIKATRSCPPWAIEALSTQCTGDFVEADLFALRETAAVARKGVVESLLEEAYPDPPRWKEIMVLSELQALASVESLRLFESHAQFTKEVILKDLVWLLAHNGTFGEKTVELWEILERSAGEISPELKKQAEDAIEKSISIWEERLQFEYKFEADDDYDYTAEFARLKRHVLNLREMKARIATL